MQDVRDLEEAGEGVLLQVPYMLLAVGEALEVVLQRVQLERGEAFLGELVGLHDECVWVISTVNPAT